MEETVEKIALLTPSANISPDIAADYVRKVTDGFDALRPHLDGFAKARAEALLDAHRRVRAVPRAKGLRYTVGAGRRPSIYAFQRLIDITKARTGI